MCIFSSDALWLGSFTTYLFLTPPQKSQKQSAVYGLQFKFTDVLVDIIYIILYYVQVYCNKFKTVINIINIFAIPLQNKKSQHAHIICIK